MVDLDMDRFEDIVDNHIRLRGIERTINQVVFPFLERIGILWITSHINPAQEHLVSNIIRQKLIVGIDSVTTSLKVDKTILLFLPEGEHHELGMLFMYFLLKSRGVSTIYLGANVPLHDVEYVVNLKKPDYLFSHLTAVAYSFNFDRFLATMTKKFTGIPIVISGMLTQTYERKIPMQITFKRSFSEVIEFIATL
jgi:methanogenic corrinoid protein MtbC1